MTERGETWQRFTPQRAGETNGVEAEQKTVARCVLRVQRWAPSNERDGRFLWTLLERTGPASFSHVTNGLAPNKGAAKRAAGVALKRVGWVCG